MKLGRKVLNGSVFVFLDQDKEGLYLIFGQTKDVQSDAEKHRVKKGKNGNGWLYKLTNGWHTAEFSDI